MNKSRMKFVIFLLFLCFHNLLTPHISFADYDPAKDPGLKAVRELLERIKEANNTRERNILQKELDELVRTQASAEKRVMSEQARALGEQDKLQRQVDRAYKAQKAAQKAAEEAAKEKAARLAALKVSGFMGRIGGFFRWGNPLGLLQVSPVQYIDAKFRDAARNDIVIGGHIDRIRLLSAKRKREGLDQKERREYEKLREMLINEGYTSVNEAIQARNAELRRRGFTISE